MEPALEGAGSTLAWVVDPRVSWSSQPFLISNPCRGPCRRLRSRRPSCPYRRTYRRLRPQPRTVSLPLAPFRVSSPPPPRMVSLPPLAHDGVGNVIPGNGVGVRGARDVLEADHGVCSGAAASEIDGNTRSRTRPSS